MTRSELLERARDGDVRAIGRVLSQVENRSETGASLFAQTFVDGGNAWTTGVTGTPGAGKSTLVSGVIPLLVGEGQRLAVVAVDPSSPFTGGAILGDRIRMAAHDGDPRVYIRSVANRGSLGGIAETTPAIVATLDGLGFYEVLVETVGIGQSEVEIATAADTTVVVVSPGWGDAIQTSKAGFLEVADIFVVNKADREGAEHAATDLEAMLAMGQKTEWRPPVVQTVAPDGDGLGDLVAAIGDHREYLVHSGDLGRRRLDRAAHQLAAAVKQQIESATSQSTDSEDIVSQIAGHQLDPWSAASSLLAAG